ncbi:MAG: hypothetical protein RBT60_09300 [Candidatus Krumholzibacteria bacterium]|jgi:hypothetical protein|nr:hypothetical protein [Candidatus Krumholzibacteria bacterium]
MSLIPENLAFLRKDPAEIEAIRPDLGEALTLGLDLRSLLYQGEQGRSSQFDMQADVYVSIQADAQFAAYVEIGLHRQRWKATGSLLQGGGRTGESFAGRLVLRQRARPVNLAIGNSILRRELPSGHARAHTCPR